MGGTLPGRLISPTPFRGPMDTLLASSKRARGSLQNRSRKKSGLRLLQVGHRVVDEVSEQVEDVRSCP